MNDLAQGFAAPQYICNTQSTVDPEVESSQPELLEERQGSQVPEDGRTEGNHILLGHNQGRQLMNEMGYESYQDSQIRETSYQAESHPSQQGVQGENIVSQPNGFLPAPYGQYQYPSQSQGYSSTATGFIDLGQAYTAPMGSQQYPPLSQYSSQHLAMSETSQFSTPAMSAGQTPYASPPHGATHYPAPIVQHVRARRTEVKKHQCPTCPRSFLRPSALVSHKRIHTEETPFYCRLPRCGRGVGARGFNVRSNCVRHEKGHIEKGELPALRPPQRGIAQPRL